MFQLDLGDLEFWIYRFICLAICWMWKAEDLARDVNRMDYEGWTEDRISKFHYAVVQALPLERSFTF